MHASSLDRMIEKPLYNSVRIIRFQTNQYFKARIYQSPSLAASSSGCLADSLSLWSRERSERRGLKTLIQQAEALIDSAIRDAGGDHVHDGADTTREHVTATREHVTAPSDDATLPIVYQVRNMCHGLDVVALVLISEYGIANHQSPMSLNLSSSQPGSLGTLNPTNHQSPMSLNPFIDSTRFSLELLRPSPPRGTITAYST
jgi:hypothetical protein